MNIIDDRASFDDLYRSCHPEVLAYCRRRLPGADAEEAAGEVFAVLWRRWADLPPEDQRLPYTYGVARRVVSTRRRSGRRWDRLTGRMAGLAATSPSIDDVLVMREEQRMVVEALSRLSEPDQEILRLSAWEGLSNREAATVLGISADAADQRLSRAKQRLAHAYRRVETGRGWR